ncbi:GntR family transcriptional regulator [Acidaminobacter sp.]|uniref:GntR family transcriptional regulator n=1 Tax=Acidaminobacter sp. TaxID=1872102 RepID=UPI0013861F4E|nr:GntR family transcriptional regulator [Acidaminobacter sp.]MDK9710158.1 GntR family transcriptional regulator [Acidaminobacter sp.]MZQ98756.1 FCD domain-containing protein [Acidaminobacter sp.]
MKIDIFPQTEKTTVGEYVYDLLKMNIVRMKLEPGNRISENEISELLGVSRTPVREAFIKLSREGLLYILPQRGTYIAKIDLDQVEEARFIREVLESAVLKIVTQGISDEFLDRLDANLEEQQKCLVTRDLSKYFELDEAFHRIIFESVNKLRTWIVIDQVNTQYKRVRILSYTFDNMINSLIEQHAQLVEAIRLKNDEKAQLVIGNHIRKLIHEQADLKARYPKYF